MEIDSIPHHSIALPVVDQSQIGDARRTISRLAEEYGFEEHEKSAAALVTTELASNLVKYARNGQLVIRVLSETSVPCLEILSLDSGPGIVDVPKHIEDGFSTGGTAGCGLGAIRRLSHEFDIYSSRQSGTAVLSRIYSSSPTANGSNPPFSFGVVNVPFTGEERCGDSWGVYQSANRALFMLIDGLGHGVIAADAADTAVKTFSESSHRTAVQIVDAAHGALRSTRGGVMAVVEVFIDDKAVSYCGVGNISAAIFGGGRSQHMISMNGTVGLAAKPKAYSYTWNEVAILVMASDGLTTHWSLDEHPGLMQKHPSLIAGVLYQHHSRGRDDVTVLVARWNKG